MIEMNTSKVTELKSGNTNRKTNGALQHIVVKTFQGDEYITHNGDVVITITRLRHGQPVVLQDDLGRHFVLIAEEEFNRLTEFHDAKMKQEALAEYGKRVSKGEADVTV